MMKHRVGYKWKAIDGIHKGQWFVITAVGSDYIECKRKGSDRVYQYPRQFFDEYIERVNKYWSERNISYKSKKERLKNE